MIDEARLATDTLYRFQYVSCGWACVVLAFPVRIADSVLALPLPGWHAAYDAWIGDEAGRRVESACPLPPACLPPTTWKPHGKRSHAFAPTHAAFCDFGSEDIAALKASAPLVAPLVPSIVDAVYVGGGWCWRYCCCGLAHKGSCSYGPSAS